MAASETDNHKINWMKMKSSRNCPRKDRTLKKRLLQQRTLKDRPQQGHLLNK